MSFDYQPSLDGALISLRPLKPEDYHDLYAVARDPLVWEQHPAQDRHDEAVFGEFFREALESGGALVVRDAASGQVIGSSRYHGYDKNLSEVEVGWTFLARSYWGGLYNGEMKSLMLAHAFRYVECVVLIIGLDNVRSQRAAEKIGAIRDGTRPDDQGHDSYVYRVRRTSE